MLGESVQSFWTGFVRRHKKAATFSRPCVQWHTYRLYKVYKVFLLKEILRLEKKEGGGGGEGGEGRGGEGREGQKLCTLCPVCTCADSHRESAEPARFCDDGQSSPENSVQSPHESQAASRLTKAHWAPRARPHKLKAQCFLRARHVEVPRPANFDDPSLPLIGGGSGQASPQSTQVGS